MFYQPASKCKKCKITTEIPPWPFTHPSRYRRFSPPQIKRPKPHKQTFKHQPSQRQLTFLLMVHHEAMLLWHFLLLLLWSIKIAEMTGHIFHQQAILTLIFKFCHPKIFGYFSNIPEWGPLKESSAISHSARLKKLFHSCLQLVYKETAHL